MTIEQRIRVAEFGSTVAIAPAAGNTHPFCSTRGSALSFLAGKHPLVAAPIHVRVPDDVVPTVTANCNTLKFKTHGFE